MTLPAVSALCGVFILLLADSPIFYSAMPKGSCFTCCEINERDDIKFMLYTRKNPYKFQYLYLKDDKRLSKSNFNYNYPLAIYMHGFSESATGDKQSSQEVKDAFLESGNYNVILIDWSPMTAAPWYMNAKENIAPAAKYVAKFINFLLHKGYQLQKIHLIGFSLGAELAGIVGKKLQQEWGIYLPRITGLDPALPMFEDGSSNLNPEAAQFVDIIHTDGGFFGNPNALGHADFYPNEGRGIQPGCVQQEINNYRWLGIISCSHQRAWQYFIESVRSPFAFPASNCRPTELFATCQDNKGKAFMGMGADKRLRGKFFLDTADESPYGGKTLGSSMIKRNNKLKTNSAQLVLIPAIQKKMQELEQQQQQLQLIQQQHQYQQQQQQQQQLNNNNVTTKYDTLMDAVVTTAAIQSNSSSTLQNLTRYRHEKQ